MLGKIMEHQKKYNKNLIPNAKRLRKNMTAAEKHLWYDFLKLHPLNFSRQKVIGKYIADFYCAKAKLVIEIDGRQHYSEDGLEHDLQRTEFLETFGLKVLRFTNYEITYKFEYVCNCIETELSEPLP